MTKVRRRSIDCLLLCLIYSCAEPIIAGSATFDSASEHYQQGNWEQAAAALEKVLAGTGYLQESLDARFYLAECRMQLGQYAQAYNGYLDLLETEPGKYAGQASYRAGEAALLAGDRATGRELLQNFVRKYPDDSFTASALCHLGQLAQQSGNLPQAADAYRLIIERHSSSSRLPDARLGLAKALLVAGKPNDVADVLGLPGDYSDVEQASEVSLLLGRALFESNQTDQALFQFRTTMRRFPESIAARRARIAAAWALWRLERIAEIERVIAPLAQQSEWLADYHYLMGMAAYGQEDWAEGTGHLGKAAMLRHDHPSHDAILYYQAICYLRQDRNAAAKNLLDRLRVEHPDSEFSADAIKELSQITPTDNAIAASRSITPESEHKPLGSGGFTSFYEASASPQRSPAVTKANQLLDEAIGLERDGRYGSAIAAYQELIELKQSTDLRLEGLLRCARLHYRLDRHPMAIKQYSQLLTEDPATPYGAEAISALSWMQLASGKKAAARIHFQQLLEKFPQSPQAAEAAYWLATVAADEKDSDQAVRYLTLVVDALRGNEDGSARQQQVFAQAISLRCQLAADQHDWSTIERITSQTLPTIGEGVDRLRIEYWQAEALFRSKQFKEARESFENLDPRTFGTYESWVAMVPLRRAQLAARRQQWTEVLKFIARIDREYPDFLLTYEADYLRGRAEAGRGRFNAARRAYNNVIANELAEGTETAVAAQWMIGETFFHQENFELARAAYQAVLDREAPADWQARAALQLGKCWELDENWEEARAMYGEALQRWPDTQPQEKILARLKWAESRTNLRR